MSNLKKVSIAENSNNDERIRISLPKRDFNSLTDPKEREIYVRGFDPNSTGPKVGKRHIQACLMFVCLALGYGTRSCFSIAVIAMTDKNASPNPDVPTYDWKNTSVMLSSFFWGYVCLQVLAGYLGNTYGPKFFLLPAFAINSVACMLIPVAAAKIGPYGVVACRVIQGLSQGFQFPSCHSLLGKWAPVEERTTLGALVYTGTTVGTIVSSIVSGYIASSWAGWPAAFYVFGGLGLGWCVLFFAFGHNSPALHPSITKKERNYIEASLGTDEDSEHVPVPWKAIFTSLPVYAIIMANMSGAWGYAMMSTEIPTYLGKVMNFKISSNGVVNAVPYLVAIFTGNLSATLSDYLLRNRYISLLNSRRFFQVLGVYGQLICILLLTFVAKTQTITVLLLSIGNGFNGAVIAGYGMNHVDISPRFCGILQGIANGGSQVVAIFAPLLVQFVVTNQEDALQWRVVFIVTAVLYFACGTFFACFVSATRQKWDGPSTEAPENIERMKKKSSVVSIHSIEVL